MCNATGRPEPPHNVDWHKDDEKVRSDAHGGIIITKKIETRVLVSMLVIKNSRKDDAGTYECRSSTGETGSIFVHVLTGTLTGSTTVLITGRTSLMHRRIGRYRRSEHRKSMTSLKLVADTPLRQLTLIVTLKKVKVAHTRLPSVGLRSWSRFLAVSLQVTWIINPTVGCRQACSCPRNH